MIRVVLLETKVTYGERLALCSELGTNVSKWMVFSHLFHQHSIIYAKKVYYREEKQAGKFFKVQE